MAFGERIELRSTRWVVGRDAGSTCIVLMLMLMLLLPCVAQAQYCTAVPNPPQFKFTSPAPTSLIVRPSDALGHVYFTVSMTQPGYAYADCSGSRRSTDTVFMALVSSLGGGYYDADVPGMSWYITRAGRAFASSDVRTIGPGRVSSTTTTWTMSLVKSAATGGTGRLRMPSVEGRFETSASTVVSYWDWTLVGFPPTIVRPACSVRGTSIALGNVLTSAMASVGSTTPTSASSDLVLTCSSNPRVDMKLITTPINGTTNVLALTGGTGAASGVGVQLIYNNAVMVPNTEYRVSNSAAATLNVPIAARYYRTGTVRPGVGNAAAVVQFTYP